MGEARRRKKLDAKYGKVPSLITLEQQEKHFDLIIDDLSSQFESELTTLVFAQTIPDNYRQIRDKFAELIENRFLEYRQSDREAMALALLMYFSAISEQQDAGNVILICFMEILKPYLPLSEYEKLLEKMENVLIKFKSKL